MAFVVCSQTHLLQNPNPNSLFSPKSPNLPHISKTLTLRFSPLPNPKPLIPNLLTSKRLPKPYPILKISATSGIAPLQTTPPSESHLPLQPLLSNSTKTLSTIFAIAFSVSNQILQSIRSFSEKLKRISPTPTPDELAAIQSLRKSALCAVGPLFFAALRDRPSGYLNTPLTVVAAGMAKWLDIYSGVLMVRVLLSWFPNIPWDRQPLSAIRDLCDPYLNLFRNIIPPVFDTLDVSPLLAFAVLGTLGSILNSSKGTFWWMEISIQPVMELGQVK